MKKYLIGVIFCIIYIYGFSQSPQSRILLGRDTITGTGGRIYLDTLKTLVCSGCTFNHGTYSDTLIVTASGGGGNNIYNTDSTLSANRTVQMSGRTMTWTSTGNARNTYSTSGASSFALNELLNSSGNGVQFGSYSTSASPTAPINAGDGFFQLNSIAVGKKLVIQTVGLASSPIHFAIDGTVKDSIGVGGHYFIAPMTQTYTIPSSPSSTGQVIGQWNVVTTAGSGSSFGQYGLLENLASGYTGNQPTATFYGFNQAQSTASTFTNAGGNGFEASLANFGLRQYTSGVTAGAQIAVHGIAANGNISIGGFFGATAIKNSARNIGAFITGLNGGTSAHELGAYIGLYSSTANPTFADAVLQLDDESGRSRDLINAQASNTTVARLDVAGKLTLGSATALSQVLNLSGSTNAYTGYYQGTTLFGLFGVSSGSGNGTQNAASGDFVIRNSQRILFSADGGTTTNVSIANNGDVLIGSAGVDNSNGKLQVTGDITLESAGNALRITEGSNGRVGQTSLTSGTKAITINGLTTSSRAFVQLVSQAGTVTSTAGYEAVCTSNTLTITAVTNAGNITNTLDTSTLNYFVINSVNDWIALMLVLGLIRPFFKRKVMILKQAA